MHFLSTRWKCLEFNLGAHNPENFLFFKSFHTNNLRQNRKPSPKNIFPFQSPHPYWLVELLCGRKRESLVAEIRIEARRASEASLARRASMPQAIEQTFRIASQTEKWTAGK
jgi:hypothetical protein